LCDLLCCHVNTVHLMSDEHKGFYHV
jgi:hypothetical protein